MYLPFTLVSINLKSQPRKLTVYAFTPKDTGKRLQLLNQPQKKKFLLTWVLTGTPLEAKSPKKFPLTQLARQDADQALLPSSQTCSYYGYHNAVFPATREESGNT